MVVYPPSECQGWVSNTTGDGAGRMGVGDSRHVREVGSTHDVWRCRNESVHRFDTEDAEVELKRDHRDADILLMAIRDPEQERAGKPNATRVRKSNL